MPSAIASSRCLVSGSKRSAMGSPTGIRPGLDSVIPQSSRPSRPSPPCRPSRPSRPPVRMSVPRDRPAVPSLALGCDRRCRTPLGDFETPPLVTGGNCERTCRQPFSPGGTPPSPEQSADSNIQVEPLGSHSKGQVVRGSSAVVSDGGRDVDQYPLGWVYDPPRLRVVDRHPSFEHTFDPSCYRDGRRRQRSVREAQAAGVAVRFHAALAFYLAR
jgi:hypothetical protein